MCSESSQRFNFNSSEIKQGTDRSQRFHFNSSEFKQRSERSQRFYSNSSELKCAVSIVRYFVY